MSIDDAQALIDLALTISPKSVAIGVTKALNDNNVPESMNDIFQQLNQSFAHLIPNEDLDQIAFIELSTDGNPETIELASPFQVTSIRYLKIFSGTLLSFDHQGCVIKGEQKDLKVPFSRINTYAKTTINEISGSFSLIDLIMDDPNENKSIHRIVRIPLNKDQLIINFVQTIEKNVQPIESEPSTFDGITSFENETYGTQS